MTILNYTPHIVRLRFMVGQGWKTLEIPSSGQAIVETGYGETLDLDLGLPVPVLALPVYGAVTGLPPEQPGTWIIVSELVLRLAKDRHDLLCLAEGIDDQAVRSDFGELYAVWRLNAHPR
jgi:hypothetical protein